MWCLVRRTGMVHTPAEVLWFCLVAYGLTFLLKDARIFEALRVFLRWRAYKGTLEVVRDMVVRIWLPKAAIGGWVRQAIVPGVYADKILSVPDDADVVVQKMADDIGACPITPALWDAAWKDFKDEQRVIVYCARTFRGFPFFEKLFKCSFCVGMWSGLFLASGMASLAFWRGDPWGLGPDVVELAAERILVAATVSYLIDLVALRLEKEI